MARKSNLANAKFDNLSLFDNVKEHVTESEGQLWLEYCPVEGFECEGTCCLPSTSGPFFPAWYPALLLIVSGT